MFHCIIVNYIIIYKLLNLVKAQVQNEKESNVSEIENEDEVEKLLNNSSDTEQVLEKKRNLTIFLIINYLLYQFNISKKWC
jgi:hypothetical protein